MDGLVYGHHRLSNALTLFLQVGTGWFSSGLNGGLVVVGLQNSNADKLCQRNIKRKTQKKNTLRNKSMLNIGTNLRSLNCCTVSQQSKIISRISGRKSKKDFSSVIISCTISLHDSGNGRKMHCLSLNSEYEKTFQDKKFYRFALGKNSLN